MRTICVLALVSSLLAAGCRSTVTNGGGLANHGYPSTDGVSYHSASGCASGDCGTSANFSDYQYDCGPMCGAYVTTGQTQSPIAGCDGNCKLGNSMLPGYFANATASMRGRMAEMHDRLVSRAAAIGSGAIAGRATCKGLGSDVGCGGCEDCGRGNAIGLNNSESAGNLFPGHFGGCSGKLGCQCHRCLARRKLHPYGGQLPHTANAAATGMGGSGFGAGGSAPSYAYPYYTTRGPRDFLQDGCGPPPVYPSNPRPNCLPTIGG